MPRSDSEAAAAYNRERWRSHGHIYRANRTAALPPLSRQQVLDEDVAQARELERLEAARIGKHRAGTRFAEWLAGERRWLRISSTPYVIGGLDVSD